MTNNSKMWKTREDYDYIVKIVVIGDSHVGKSSILMKYCDDDFSPKFITTIGIDFKVRTVHMDGKIVKLQIWDTAGQERFKTITNSYYRGAKAIMVVYDITSAESFEHVQSWIENMDSHCDSRSPPMKMLIGNKCDLTKDRVIEEKKGLALAKEFGLQFMEVSAKNGTNIEKAFIDLAKKVVNEMMKKTLEDTEKSTYPISLELDVENGDNNKKCCW